MGSLKLTTASSGSVILSPANTASDVTITVPAVTGTMITTASTFAGTGPAFSAYQSVAQTLSSTVNTKLQFQTKEFDTANCFDNTTNYRFTPNVAGYYQITAAAALVTSVASWCQLKLYKNGSYFKQSFAPSSSSNIDVVGFTGLVYANGTTDYFEIYGVVGSGQNTSASQVTTWFSASMVRAA